MNGHPITRDPGSPLVIDIDATLVTAHSEKEGAAATFKKGFGLYPLWASSTTAPQGPGDAGSNTAADHITVLRAALRQLPGDRTGRRPGRRVLIRIDGADSTHGPLDCTGCRTRSGSASPSPSSTPLPHSPPRSGSRPTTPIGNPEPVPGSSRPPAC